ncbi:Gfo/Idh/MocA family protein [Actinokineospora sp. G85]|uniref:Gfo/Idh/MocA family protein n=1 Tax=Actinokineospora sp. G85 TaxID=3406626 RepID=UPI003C746064
MPREIGLIGATAIAVRAVVGPARSHEGVRVRAVAASTAERAERFRAEHGLERAYSDYQALLDDDDIDTVYISLHNSAHAQWAAAAARAGKHVIVEKPLCLGSREAHAIQGAAAESGVHVVEAVITTDQAWLRGVREIARSGELGELTGIESHVAFDVVGRGGYRFRPELGGGAFFDTAGYWLDAVQGVVGLDGAVAGGESDFDGPNGVDVGFQASLAWASGLRARLRAALVGPYRADHEFVFDLGRVRVRNFLRPAAGVFPVNLVVQHGGGRREVRSCPAGSYYDQQFARIVSLLDTPARDDTAAVQRAGLMESAYLDALAKHRRRKP